MTSDVSSVIFSDDNYKMIADGGVDFGKWLWTFWQETNSMYPWFIYVLRRYTLSPIDWWG